MSKMNAWKIKDKIKNGRKTFPNFPKVEGGKYSLASCSVNSSRSRCCITLLLNRSIRQNCTLEISTFEVNTSEVGGI